MLKKELCNELIKYGNLKEFDVVNHSYNWGGGNRPLEKVEKWTNGIFPTITTRVDTLGVVVKCKRQVEKR